MKHKMGFLKTVSLCLGLVVLSVALCRAQAQSSTLKYEVDPYTLAIGHHIGVIDCFSAKLEIPCDGYARWIARLPKGEARRKLEGLSRFGEIEIAAPHVHLLKEALNAGLDEMCAEEAEWTACLNKMLQAIAEEPALYLMVRRR